MFGHFLKTSFRSLLRARDYTIIHFAGLSAGISIFLLIFIIVRFETSFDDFHPQARRIYRTLIEYHHPGDLGIFYGAGAPTALVHSMKDLFPDVKLSTGVFNSPKDLVQVLNDRGETEKKFSESKSLFAVEPDFFSLFSFPWLAGSPAQSLAEPYSVVLTRETANRYFGDWKTALGKTIQLNNFVHLKVTGILENPRPNTDFQLKLVVPYKLFAKFGRTDWYGGGSEHDCYIRLPEGETPEGFNRRLRDVYKKNRPAGVEDEMVIQSMNEVHYYDAHSHTDNFLGRTISRETIRVLWMVGAFILVIACMNFVNLSTAHAVIRSREVGVRKVLGGSSWQLRGQFLMETFLLVLGSSLVALLLTAIALPAVAGILKLPITRSFVLQPQVLVTWALLIISVTLLSGFYPAILLSGFNPIQALKSRFFTGPSRGINLRRALVIVQFVIAQALIIGLLVMIRQMNYFYKGPMGFDRQALITVPLPWDSIRVKKIDYLRDQVQRIPGVIQLSFNNNPPVTAENDWSDFKFNHEAKSNQLYSIPKFVDSNYIHLFNIPLAAGRNIRPGAGHEFLINEQLMRKLGYQHPEDVLNKEMDLGWDSLKGPVVGVVRDFHSTGFKDKYSCVFLTSYPKGFGKMSIKLGSENAASAIKAITALWNKTYPNGVFEYHYLDENINSFYGQEDQLYQLLKIFALVAIFLGCLGLYGLASFMAAQRTKEVGIRKVLGASEGDIVYLFSREFMLLVLIAFLIAAPIAGWAMTKWLQDYAFRLPIAWWIFLGAGMLAAIIALATISIKGIRAAKMNPVVNLRME